MALTEEMKERLKNNILFKDDPKAVGAITLLIINEPNKESATELCSALEELLKEL